MICLPIQRTFIGVHRKAILTSGLENQAEVVARLDFSRQQARRLLEANSGSVQFAQLQADQSKIVVHGSAVGVEPHGFKQAALGLRWPPGQPVRSSTCQ
ncbi:MAG TPA: hypothetical protein VMZ31_05250 [Phycisphaerae bacterium]|nr:hypothetical protein [Phycisphaerae bacterium]